MANLKAALHAAEPTVSAAILCVRTVDALDDLACSFSALEAVEQLISPQKRDTTEDLAHVDRASLGMLLTLLNVGMREQINTARAAAELARTSPSL